MGSQVTAHCECGLDVSVLIGGSRANFRNTCYFPCLCEACQHVVQANLLAKPLVCPRCGTSKLTPYDDPGLKGSSGKEAMAEWNMERELGRVLILTDGTYKCPKCGKMTLRFFDGGLCWD